nr:translation initiation factor IF-2-like [Macaca fascicularis]
MSGNQNPPKSQPLTRFQQRRLAAAGGGLGLSNRVWPGSGAPQPREEAPAGRGGAGCSRRCVRGAFADPRAQGRAGQGAGPGGRSLAGGGVAVSQSSHRSGRAPGPRDGKGAGRGRRAPGFASAVGGAHTRSRSGLPLPTEPSQPAAPPGGRVRGWRGRGVGPGARRGPPRLRPRPRPKRRRRGPPCQWERGTGLPARRSGGPPSSLPARPLSLSGRLSILSPAARLVSGSAAAGAAEPRPGYLRKRDVVVGRNKPSRPRIRLGGMRTDSAFSLPVSTFIEHLVCGSRGCKERNGAGGEKPGPFLREPLPPGPSPTLLRDPSRRSPCRRGAHPWGGLGALSGGTGLQATGSFQQTPDP